MAGKMITSQLEFWGAEDMAMPLEALVSVLSDLAKKYKGEGYCNLRFVFERGWADETGGEDGGCYLCADREETETSDKEQTCN